METPLKARPLTESEGILVKVDPAPYDLRKAILAIEKRLEKLEHESIARNTPAEPAPVHLPFEDEYPSEPSDSK